MPEPLFWTPCHHPHASHHTIIELCDSTYCFRLSDLELAGLEHFPRDIPAQDPEVHDGFSNAGQGAVAAGLPGELRIGNRIPYSTSCFAVYPSRAITWYLTSFPFWSFTLSGAPSGPRTSTFSFR